MALLVLLVTVFSTASAYAAPRAVNVGYFDRGAVSGRPGAGLTALGFFVIDSVAALWRRR